MTWFSVALESWSWLYMCSTRQQLWKFWDILSTQASQWHRAMMNLFEVQTFSPINTKPASNSDFWIQKIPAAENCALCLQGTSYNNSGKAVLFFFLQVKYIPSTYFNERWKTSALGTKVIIFPPKITPVQTQRYNNVVCGACTSAKLYRQ